MIFLININYHNFIFNNFKVVAISVKNS